MTFEHNRSRRVRRLARRASTTADRPLRTDRNTPLLSALSVLVAYAATLLFVGPAPAIAQDDFGADSPAQPTLPDSPHEPSEDNQGSAGQFTALPPLECNEQEPQAFLIRSNYLTRSSMTPEERAARREAHQAAIRYRTENYGYVRSFGEPAWNDSTPSDNAKEITFMGLQVRLNRRIVPALRCVEAEIERICADFPYEPHRLSGLRTRNTYHTGEVSNHMYGIAIDIDPDLNTCCGCTARWRRHPLCQREVDSIFERMAMPECWVHAFERYGFYWLGHDELQDTMHFEFLGDPDHILREPEPASD